MATALGFSELALGRLALVVTELATNLVRHANDGMLLIGMHAASETTIELIAIDRGPGIQDVESSLSDGVSTAGTSGTGLGAVRRLSSQFIVFSKPGFGSVMVARLTADNSLLDAGHRAGVALAFAGICVAAPGEVVSGDSWACRSEASRAAIIVADGLGHGPEAAAAADAAVQVFERRPEEGAKDVLESCHLALRSTRGAAIATIEVDADAGTVVFCGAGNISARILSGIEDRSLMSQHGTVGLQIRRVQESRYALPEHALLVVHSDGILTRWNLKEVPELLSCDPIVLAAHLIHNELRGRDDATVVVVRCN